MRLPTALARHVRPGDQPAPEELARRALRRTRRLNRRIALLESRLAQLEEQLHPRLPQLDNIVNHLAVRPDDTLLRVWDRDGKPGLGFASPPGTTSESAYVAFENIFRGSRELIMDRLRPYVPLVEGYPGPAIDLGCGRGEFLQLMREIDIEASGFDLDAGMVEVARELGLDANVGDLFAHLESLTDDSVDIVFSARVIEHVPPADMDRLITEVHRVLSPHGLAIIETDNPHPLRAYRFFWLDRSHTVPIFPEAALLMAQSAGFSAARIVFPAGTGDTARDLQQEGEYALLLAKDPARLEAVGMIGGPSSDS